ncbi:MAG: peptide chain release factor N(5)-glutamine methyltransferase [Clostridia bacterium]|nr:peptide chain release factor N(5)-glutamine methyltransferase [Clostridia bacterium]
MTFFDVLKEAKKQLRDVTQDYEFDAWVLFSHSFEMSRSDYFLNSRLEAPDDKKASFFELVKKRKSGRPLQYLVGKWSFMDNEFLVGDGVLIPRADTECLVEEAARIIDEKGVKTVFDLCAGSGCIGISLAKMFENLEVVCFEKSDEAVGFLEKNVALNNASNVKIVMGDIFDGADFYCLGDCQMIVSNPPYIRSEEIASLSREVLFEPRQALDGGEDGLDFYRALKERWFDKISSCGSILMECGEDQADHVRTIFSEYKNVSFVKDLNNIRRVVCAVKEER